MAKMFYTIEEAASKLGKSTDEVAAMAKSGQLQEFRDREKIMFKVEQIDLLAGGGSEESAEDMGLIDLADSSEQQAIDKEESVLGLLDSREGSGIGLSDSREGSGIGLADSKAGSGGNVFTDDDMDKADPSAVTQISDSIVTPAEFSADSGPGVLSASGLDLTREADDTSMGNAALLEEAYGGEEKESSVSGASGLFESGANEAQDAGAVETSAAPMMVTSMTYAYDGGWSGMGVGLAIGAIAALVISLFSLAGFYAGTSTSMTALIASNYVVYMSAIAGVTLISGVVGYFVGRTTG